MAADPGSHGILELGQAPGIHQKGEKCKEEILWPYIEIIKLVLCFRYEPIKKPTILSPYSHGRFTMSNGQEQSIRNPVKDFKFIPTIGQCKRI